MVKNRLGKLLCGCGRVRPLRGGRRWRARDRPTGGAAWLLAPPASLAASCLRRPFEAKGGGHITRRSRPHHSHRTNMFCVSESCLADVSKPLIQPIPLCVERGAHDTRERATKLPQNF
jgi:hypothetical protein